LIGRIRERREFETLSRHGRRASTSTLWCRYVDDATAVPPRVAFAVGRSVGSAVTRNRLRRRLRHVLADAARRSSLGHGLLLVGARPAAVERSFDELRHEVHELLMSVTR